MQWKRVSWGFVFIPLCWLFIGIWFYRWCGYSLSRGKSLKAADTELSPVSATWSDPDLNTGLDFGPTTWDDCIAFEEEPQKSELGIKDYKLNTLRKDEETRIITFRETWEMTVICFREAEGLHGGNCFLPILGDLKDGKWDSTTLGRMEIINTKCRTFR